MKRYAGFFLLSIISFSAWSQTSDAPDSLRMLEEVRITDRRLSQFASGDKVAPVLPQAIGSVEHQRLATLLMQYSPVNVRSYGPTGLSTASLRGTGSNHTAVFWEGINLQSAMSGSLDLTLIPASFIDEASLQFGGAGSLFGSGTLGGAIHLSSEPAGTTLGWQGQVHQQIGSFGQHYTGVNAGYRTKQVSTYVRWFDQQADYDYPFFNRYTQRKERRQNAGINQHGLLIEQAWTPSASHRLSAKYWYQNNLVEIPEVAAAGGEAQATQADVFHRAVLQWRHQQSQQEWQVRAALLHHRLAYDDQVSIQADSRATSWITEAEHTYYINKEHWLHVGLNHTYETAEVENYPQPVARHRTALFMSYRARLLSTLEATVGARETFIDDTWSPFLPSLSLSYQAFQSWLIKAKVARSYRVPTLNDLYWAGGAAGGNPNLVPEQGWSHELGVAWETSAAHRIPISTELTVFSNHIDQWIHWLPDSLGVWTPVNVEQVWARGVELRGTVDHRFTPHFSVRLWADYTYTKATREQIKDSTNLDELHKQLVYTPHHQAKASVHTQYRAFTAGYSWMYIGEQFTSGSNRQYLSAYSVHNISLTFRWLMQPHHQLLISGQLQNLWDRVYEVRRGYPMPGRHYQISITYQFN